MNKFARVSNGVAVEFFEERPAFHVDVDKTIHPCEKAVDLGWTWDGKTFHPPNDKAPLENRTNILSAIDLGAETARLKYLTPGIGQALTYQAKVDEVRRYELDTNPIKANYPFLSAEIGVTGSSLAAVVDVVSAALKVWTEKGAEIERVRLKAKADVTKADTPDKITDIVSGIDWP